MESQKAALLSKEWIYLFTLVVISITLRFSQFYGFLGTDDSVISSHALRLIQDGMYQPISHYDSRLGLILPLAAIYSIFGIGEHQTTILPLFYSALLPFIIFLTCREFKLAQVNSFLAALTSAVLPIGIAFGSSNYPEIPFACMISLGLFFILKAKNTVDNTSDKKLYYAYLFLSFLSFFHAYLIKIEVVFILIPISAYFLFNKNYRATFAILITIPLFMLIEDVIWYQQESSNFFNRLDILTSDRASSKKSHTFGGTQLWVFPKSMFVTFYNFGLLFYFLLLSLVITSIAYLKNKSNVIGLYILCFIGFFVWLQFGSSPKHLIRFLLEGTLNTKSHLDRYLIMLVPFISVLIAYAFNTVNKKVMLLSYGILISSMMVFIPLNDISNEYVLSYKKAQPLIEKINLNTIYCDKATCTYLKKLQELNLFKGKSFENIVEHNNKTGKTRPNNNFMNNGGTIIINKNRYLYYHRRYLINYPAIESLKENAEYDIMVKNPGMTLSYAYLNTIKGILSFLPQDHFIVSKALKTVNESLDDEDILIFTVKPNQTSKLEYL